jgi:hypothetical protein
MTDIDLPHLMKLLDCDSPHDCWLSYDCIIDGTGIRVKPLDGQTEKKLTDDEWHDRKEYEKNIKLELPCTHEELIIWAQQNNFANKLPDLIPFTEAQQLLESRLKASADEMVMWVTFNELTAFRGKLPTEARKFTFEIHKFYQSEKYKNELLKLYFILDELEQLQPQKRYFNRTQLVERWAGFFKNNEFTVDEFISAKAESGDLPEYHPITGIVETDGEVFRSGFFDLGEIEQIEENELIPWIRKKTVAEIKASRTTKTNWNNQQLLDLPITTLIEESGLYRANIEDYWFSLYCWISSLKKERDSLVPPQEFPEKKDYDEKIRAINSKIDEINHYLDNRPASDAAAKAVTKWNEVLNNGEPIDWDYWKGLQNITSIQAAKLAYKIDPILWPDDKYAAGKAYGDSCKGEKIDNDLWVKIQKLEQQLKNHSEKWNLARLADFLGEDNAPFGMFEAAKKLNDTDTKKRNDDSDLTKLEKQQQAIQQVIETKQYRPLEIPDGGKSTLKTICEKDYPLLFDGDTSFENAWKESRHLFKMANHASYSKRGKA